MSRGGSAPSTPGASKMASRRNSTMQAPGDSLADLDRVKNLTRELFKNVKETETMICKGNEDKILKQRKQKEAFKKKVSTRVKNSLDSVWVADEASATAANCLSRLQHEHYSLGASLMVCQRRLELREGRPPQETKEDKLQDALLAEQEILSSARDAMLVLGGELMRRIDEITKLRTEIASETAQIRREALASEKQGNLNAFDSTQGSITSAQLESPDNLNERNKMLEEMGNRAGELRSEVEDLRQRTETLLTQSNAAATQASNHVNATLSQRTTQACALTKQMRTHVTDADFALLVAERTLERSVRKLDPDDANALSKFAASKGMVEELRAQRRDLQEDLWRKTVSLNIDEACRRVTPQWAAGCYDKSQGAQAPSIPPSPGGPSPSPSPSPASTQKQATTKSTSAPGTKGAGPGKTGGYPQKKASMSAVQATGKLMSSTSK